jgi:hypothetical protein
LKRLFKDEEKLLSEYGTYGTDDRLAIDVFNYRNFLVGRHLRQLCQQLAPTGGRKIVMVWGSAHQGAIIDYAVNEHRAEHLAKTLPREFYDLFGNESARYYSWQGSSGRWQKIQPARI